MKINIGTKVKIKMRKLRSLIKKHPEWDRINMLNDFLLAKGKKRDLIVEIIDKVNTSNFLEKGCKKEGIYYYVRPYRDTLYHEWGIPTSVFEVRKTK